MNNLYILTKQEFTSLYRFGQIPIIINKVIEVDSISKECVEKKIFEIFMDLPYFVGDEEYLIIGFENKLINDLWLEIENVTEIIPLTKAAKNSFQMKFDTKLDFKDARFENIIHKVEEAIDIQERFRGAKAFWNLCKVNTEYKPLLKNELIEIAYNKRINVIKSNEFTDDFFIHLLAYDRYEFFPNSELGYFYDIGEIFAHSKGKTSFTGSSFHSFLESNKQTLSEKSFVQIAQIISESDEVIKFTEQLTSDGLKQYIASAIFLKFKDDLAARDTIKDSVTGKLIGEIRKDKQFVNELNLAIYLTGAFFGFQKFYDDLYELVDLNIFKKKENKSRKEISVEKNHDKAKLNLDTLASATIKSDIKHSKIKDTENLKLSEEKDKKEVIEKAVSEEESTSKEQTQSSVNEYSGIKKQILKMLDEENGTFEIKSTKLIGLQKLLIPLSKNKSKPLKPEVIQILKEKFYNIISIKSKGKKFFISRITEGDLFTKV
jgi:hypothetical protein